MRVSETIFIPPPHPATLSAEEFVGVCDFSKGRRGGPGGQHRNKVETAVFVTHSATGLMAQASERRSTLENRREAIWRLRLLLAVQARTPVPDGEVRSDLWRRRCSASGTLACNPEHDDYPAMLAEAMDVVHASGLDVKRAALRLCCSGSQLTKLIKDHPAAIVALNAARQIKGMHALK